MKWILRALSALLLLVLLLGGGYALRRSRLELARHDRARQTELQRSAWLLSHELQALELRLSKIPLTDGPQALCPLLGEAASHARAAASALSLLPVETDSVSPALTFLQQCEAYAASLLRRTAAGTPLSTQDLSQIAAVRRACQRLQQGADHLDLASAEPLMALELPQEEASEPYPVMIYDGPFSDAEQNAPVVGLTGEEASLTAAIQRAAELLQVPEASVEVLGEDHGDMPGWILSCGETKLLLSRQGLHPLWILTEAGSGEVTLSPEEALALAQDYCRALGMDLPCLTWQQRQDSALVLSLAPQQQGVILYPDLVKVKVDLSSGAILSLDARRYYRSHRERVLPEPRLTREEAIALAPAGLTVASCEAAFIQPNGGDPALAWELRGEYGGERFYLFLDAQTGEMLQLLREVLEEDGTSSAA